MVSLVTMSKSKRFLFPLIIVFTLFSFPCYRVCVGIAVAPEEDQDWFCRVCISKKQGVDKKKKRKKKDKKDH